MRENKECAECGGIYYRAEHVNDVAWEARKYCSSSCSGKAMGRRGQERREAEAASLVPEAVSEPSVGVVALEKPVTGIERELKVVRVGPNPRLLVCEYFELAERRMCTVFVKRNAKFVRGMKFKMTEPSDEALFNRPWIYDGPAPRRRGRW